MTPKQIYFVQQIMLQIGNNPNMLEKHKFKTIHELANKSVSTKLSKDEEYCLKECVEELKIEHWYMI